MEASLEMKTGASERPFLIRIEAGRERVKLFILTHPSHCPKTAEISLQLLFMLPNTDVVSKVHMILSVIMGPFLLKIVA